MLFCFCVFIKLLQYTNSWHLKIDYSERSNGGDSIDKLELVFVSTSQNTIGRDYERNAEVNYETERKKLFNNNLDETYQNNYIHFNGNNIGQNKGIMPIVVDKGSLDRAKVKLDKFVMSKRPSFISTPSFNFPNRNPQFHEKFLKNNHVFKKHIKRYQEDENFGRNHQLLRILDKQNELIEKIVKENHIAEIQRDGSIEKVQDEFQDILHSVEAKINISTTTVTTTTVETSTILTLIDETEVRQALKNDPFVKRILKLAKMKNIEYKKQYG